MHGSLLYSAQHKAIQAYACQDVHRFGLHGAMEGWLLCADVYERLTPKGKKATFKTLLLTQLVAGIWHGLFPGYALFFATSAFMFESAKVIYRYEQVCASQNCFDCRCGNELPTIRAW